MTTIETLIAVIGYGAVTTVVIVAQAASPAVVGLEGTFNLISNLGPSGFAIFFGWYTITKTFPRMSRENREVVEKIAMECAAVTSRIEASKEAIVRDLTVSFREEMKAERQRNMYQMNALGERIHEANDLLHQQALQGVQVMGDVTRAILELTVLIKGMTKNSADIAVLQAKGNP